MGYYTAYELTISKFDSKYNAYNDTALFKGICNDEDIIAILRNTDFGYGYDYSSVSQLALDEHGGCCESIKGNKIYDELQVLSIMFPNALLALYADGDDSDDKSYMYYHNGKCQYCRGRIVFDEYDRRELI